jgi:hypothetical protein
MWEVLTIFRPPGDFPAFLPYMTENEKTPSLSSLPILTFCVYKPIFDVSLCVATLYDTFLTTQSVHWGEEKILVDVNAYRIMT